MYIIGLIMTILFLIAVPKFSITVVAIIVVGILFSRYSDKYFINLFATSIIAKSVLQALGMEYKCVELIYDGIVFLGNVSGMTKFYNSEFISMLLILSVVLTLLDIIIVKMYKGILNLTIKMKDKHVMHCNQPCEKSNVIDIFSKQENKYEKSI